MRADSSPVSVVPGRRDFLTIDGMFCAACAASVEALLNRQPQVRAASVSFTADAAVVDWSADADDRDGLLERVRELGYKAQFVSDFGGSDDRPADSTGDLGLRLAVAVFFGMWSMLPSVTLYFDTVTDAAAKFGLAVSAGAFSLPVIFYSGMPFYRMGIATLRYRVAGVDALILLGVAGSVALSLISLVRGGSEVFFEVAVALITLQLVGRMLDQRVRRRARDAVTSLLELAPSSIRKLNADGSETDVPLRDIAVGDVVRVRPGERVAVDARVIAGQAQLDRSLATGESKPVDVMPPASLNAGERVLDGVLTAEVTAAAGRRRIDELGRLVRQMLAEKPAWQRAVDVVAGYFLWIATIAAALGWAAVVATGGTAFEAASRALAVFVISCPCALSLAAPLVGLVASGAAARNGIILRDLNAITAAATPSRLYLDKTGTLTRGTPEITAIHPASGVDADVVREIAAAAERDSDHPLALAIKAASKATGGRVDHPDHPSSSTSIVAGRGVIRREEGVVTRVGQLRWLEDEGVVLPVLPPTAATRVGVARDGGFLGAIDLEDGLRPGMRSMIDTLRRRGIEPVILSGDADGPVLRIADELGIAAHAALTPEDKVAMVTESRHAGYTVAFVGDGLNDAPALAAADLGVAVGQSTDAARTAAAVAIVEADATVLPWLFAQTARTRRIIRQNLVWAVGYNAVAIPSAVLGWVHPAIAAAAMALSSITVVLNALRAGRVRQP